MSLLHLPGSCAIGGFSKRRVPRLLTQVQLCCRDRLSLPPRAGDGAVQALPSPRALLEVLAALHPWQARAAAGCRAAGQEGTQPPAQLTGRLACTLCCCNKRPPAASAGHGGPCSTGEQLVVLPGRAAKPLGLYKAPLAAEVTAHVSRSHSWASVQPACSYK